MRIWATLFFGLMLVSGYAQNFSSHIGGANGLVPSINYEQYFYEKHQQGKGLRISAGFGYIPGVKVVNVGAAAIFGKRSNWEVGTDMAHDLKIFDDRGAAYMYNYFYFGFRFGPGRVRGITAFGPTFTNKYGGENLGLKLKLGVSVRAFKTKEERMEKKRVKKRFSK